MESTNVNVTSTDTQVSQHDSLTIETPTANVRAKAVDDDGKPVNNIFDEILTFFQNQSYLQHKTSEHYFHSIKSSFYVFYFH